MSRAAIEDLYRLSPLQEGMLFESLRQPGSGVYVIQVACRLEGRLDRPAFERAWRETVQRHPVLRTSFHWEGMEHPHQVVHRRVELPLEVEDWQGIGPESEEERFRCLLRRDRRRGFDLERAPLLRLTLVRLGNGRRRLLWTHHHLILDGWSVPLVLREVFGRYASAVGDTDTPGRELPPAPPFRRALERMLTRDREAAERFWRRELAGLDAPTPVPLPEPVDGEPGAGPEEVPFPGVHRLALSRTTTAALDAFARREGVTPGTLVQGAWAVALSRWASVDDVLFGVVVSGRPPELPGVDAMVGPFINTLPLRVPVPPDARLGPWLRALRERLVAVEEHGRVSLVEIQGWSDVSRDRPLFETLVAFENYPLDALEGGVDAVGGLTVSGVASWERDAVPLGLSALPGDRMELLLRFDRSRFDGAAVRRLAEQVRIVLDAMAHGPADAALGAIPSLSAAERHRLTVEWSQAAEAGPGSAGDAVHPVIETFCERAARASEAPALCLESARVPADASGSPAFPRWITYGALLRRVGRLASVLVREGAGPERPVAVLADDPAEAITALLAVLAAGAVYVPLDPAHPRRRRDAVLAEVAESAAARGGEALLLTAGDAVESSRLPPGVRRIEPKPETRGGPGTLRAPVRVPEAAAAYTIFTSGSTGTPNGVVVSREALARHLATVRRAYCLGPGDRVLQLQSFAFDASVEQVLAPLTAGGCLMLRSGPVWSASELVGRLERWRVTVANLPTAYWSEVIREGAAPAVELPALRLMLVGGEAMAPAAVDRWSRWARAGSGGAPPALLINAYGPTETVITATLQPVSPEVAGSDRRGVGRGSVPIGRPLPGRSAVLLDPHGGSGEPVPEGAPGELCLGGIQARGYLGRPALTAERFVPEPRPRDPEATGGRLYRTGDRVRWLPGGRLEFLGRLDDQVKIRGHRVEPAEAARALENLREVAEAVVIVRRPTGALDSPVELTAFAVPAAGPADGGTLRAALARRLPDPLVPSAVVMLDALPRTPTGKVDRKALRSLADGAGPSAPSAGRRAVESLAVRPRTPVEEELAALWAEVLELPAVGRRDRFFDLGGHSLVAMRVVSRIRDAFGVELPLGALFEHPTVAGLAGEIEQVLSGGADAEGTTPTAAGVPPLRARPRPRTESEPDVLLPASAGQERLWFLDRLDPSSTAYNLPVAVGLYGALDPVALAAALTALVIRHETLRTTFVEVSGRPVQRIEPPPDPRRRRFEVPRIDLSALPEGPRRAEADRLTDREAERSFDLDRGPLLRAALLRLGGGPDAAEHRLLLTLHHAVSDEWSLAVLVGELTALYEAGGGPADRLASLPPLPIQYADWAGWQREWVRSKAFTDALERWRERLAGAPEASFLPTDRPRPAVRTDRGGRVPVSLPAPLAERLRSVGRKRGASLFMVLLAAFHAWLRRHGAGDDLVLGTPVANRTHPEIEGLIGFFVNTVAVRTRLPGDPRFDELLERVRADSLDAYARQGVPFEWVVDAVAPERSLGHAPLVQVMLALHTVALPRIDLEGLVVEPLPVTGETAKLDLLLELTDGEAAGSAVDASVDGTLEYSADLFDRATVVRLADHLVRLLEGVARSPEARIGTLPLLSDAERRQVGSEWAGPRRRSGPGPTLPERFAARAAERPDAVAVVCGTEAVTYGELRRRALLLARRLTGSRGRTVADRLSEIPIGLLADRSVELVEGVLGILTAGAAYVSLDPRYPADRIGLVLDDAGVETVVTAGALTDGGELPATPGRARVAIRKRGGDRSAVTDRPAPPDPDTLAYVLFTSGSTGRPKGVQVGHAAAARLFRATEGTFAPTADDAWTLFHSPAFDFSVWELWGALAYGGRLEVVPYWRTRSPEAFSELLAARRITVVSQTPSAFRALDGTLRDRPRRALPALRWLVFGGERLQPAALEGWLEPRGTVGRIRVANLYGITETTVHTTFREMNPEDLELPWRSPIGRPLPDLATYVVAPGSDLAPIGVPGELLVGGAGLARGYLGRPARTAERFVPDPFASGADPGGGRLYRSGDLVRWLPSGELEFLGRIDHQVKVRGFRIEPGEVETVLEALPGVSRAVVTARDDLPGGGGLVAYLVLGSEPSPGAHREAALGEADLHSDLRRALLETLPEFMVPVRFVPLERLPLTPVGKVDRKALPEPSAGGRGAGSDRDDVTPPRTRLERELVRIWEEVLELDRIGVEQDFFDLGGHSLLATQVVSRVREVLGMDVPVRTLFARPTVAALAGELEAGSGGGTVRGPVGGRITARSGPEEGPLSPAQERLWFLDRFESDEADRSGGASLNIALGLRLRGRLDGAALAAALDRLRARHRELRAAFPEVAGRPVRVVQPFRPGQVPLGVVDLAALPPERREATAERLAATEAGRPFRVAEGPLLRLTLIVLGVDAWRLHLTVHHLVADGWSLGILVRELTKLYAARREGTEAPLPEPPIDYADYARWLRDRLDRGELDGQLDFWRRRLAGAPPVLELPTDRPRSPVQAGRGGWVSRALDPALAVRVRELARSADASLFMTLLAGLGVVLGRWAGQDEVVIGAPVAGRTRHEMEGLVGLFLNHLALRLPLGPEESGGAPSFRGILERARNAALDAFEHQEVPFERVLEELTRRAGDGAPIRDLSRTPVFQVYLNVLNFPLDEIVLPELSVEPLGPPEAPPKFDLELYAGEPAGRGGPIRLVLAYDADLFDRWRAEEILDQLSALLVRAADRPEVSAASLSLVTERGRRARPAPVDPPDRIRAWPGPVHALLERRADEAPERIALVREGADGSSAVTFGRLQAAVERLAAVLAGAGVGPGDVVAIHARRSPALVAAVHGTLRAGAAFLLLDPAHPPARNALCLKVARPRAWLDLVDEDSGPGEVSEPIEAALDGLPGPLFRACLGSLEASADWPGEPGAGAAAATPRPPEVGPGDPAYVAFTSGSTGVPKGVVGLHDSLTRFLPWQGRALGLSPEDRFSLLSGLAHDPLHRDLFTPLWTGASVAVPEDGRLGEPGWLAAWMARLRVTVTHLTPALGQILTEIPGDSSGRSGPRIGSLRRALFVGDRLARRDVDRLRRLAPGVEVINLYGATETQRAVGWHTVGRSRGAAEIVPLGGEMPGVELAVLAAGGGMAGVGEVGEVELRSPHVALGYLGDPRATAERFRPEPDSDAERDPERSPTRSPGGRAYRTGDLGRLRGDGTVEPLGRVDRQVKIRGLRVEPGEVEAALQEHTAVERAAIVLAPGSDRLVAYLVPARGGEAPASAELRRFLAERLPEPMVPGAFVALERLPMTPNRKLDRSALPAPPPPGAGRDAGPGGWAAGGADHGLDPTAELVAGIWQRVLELPEPEWEALGPGADFFELGGHSLQVTRVLARVRETFGVELPVRSLFEQPTLAGFARRVETARKRGAQALPALEPLSEVENRDLPLSFGQERLWFLHRLAPASPLYHVSRAVELRGPLDRRALARALDRLAARHGSLRTGFHLRPGGPVQRVAPGVRSFPAVAVLDRLPAERRTAESVRLVRALARRPFDLTRPPLVRTLLVRLGPEEHHFAWTLHHTIGDGWSMGLLVRDLAALYREEAGGAPADLPELPLRYADYARWQRARATDELLDEARAWWRDRLEPPPDPLRLPVDRSRATTPRGAPGRRQAVTVPPETAGDLRRLARTERATPFMVVLAAFQALLGRWSGSSRVAVGTPVADRRDPRLEGVVGFFVDTLVLVGDLEGERAFRELVGRVRDETLGAFAHRELPFEKLVEELQPVRDRRRPPLFQVMLAFQNLPRPPATLGSELKVEPLPPPATPALFDLTLSLTGGEGGALVGFLEGDGALFDATTVRRLAGHVERFVAAAVRTPERRPQELPLLSPPERHQVLLEWSQAGGAAAGGSGDGGELLHGAFVARAVETPDAVAVVQGGRTLTFEGLYRRAAVLAERIRSTLEAESGDRLGGPAEPRIGIALGRSPEQVVALFGVLLAGAAYVPLDPELPAERLRRVAGEAEIAAVLVGSEGVHPNLSLAGRADPDSKTGSGEVWWGAPVLTVEPLGHARGALRSRPAGLGRSVGAGAWAWSAHPDRPAYVLFTSGSTGVPKGVMVSHRSAAHFCGKATENLGLGPADRRLQVAPLSFDASVADIFPILGAGGVLVLRPAGPVGSLDELLRSCRERRVTVLGLPTALWHELVASDARLPRAVRRVVFGGEAALAERVLAWRRRVGSGVALLNAYGPTETTVAVATCELAAPGLALGPAGEVPIGRPNLGDRILALDPEGRPVPAGVTGELWIGGPGVARGYLGRPGRTAESFRPDPLARSVGAPGGRLYRSGDLGRWLPDGTLVFSGRADRQVKVRGYRVELGEVESALVEHPAVHEAVAGLRPGPGGVAALVAYGAGRDLDEETLRAFLGERLPVWAVPAAFVLLDALPRTPSGKIDRRALPDPAPEALRRGAGAPGIPPRTDLERRIAAVWEEVLDADPVGVTDDFFELGGHSLLAVRLAARMERALERPFPVATLFDHPTVEAQAAALAREGGEPGPRIVVPLAAASSGLSKPLVLVPPAGGGFLGLTELARRLRVLAPRRPIWGLQAPGLEGEEEPLETVDALAQRFLEEMGRERSASGVHLVGWSFGALVAFEMARRLAARGDEPGLVAAIDAAPAGGGSATPEPIEDEAVLLARALSEAVPGVRAEELRGLGEEERVERLLVRARRMGAVPPDFDERRAERLLRVFTASLRAARAYRPGALAGELLLFRATGASHLPDGDPAAAWRPLVRGAVRVVDVPGDHRSVVSGDGARAVALALAGLLEARDGSRGGGLSYRPFARG